MIREFFTIKSRRQKEEEQRQYNAWAFPYGQMQLQRVSDMILELMPDEKQTGMVVYLIGREAYWKRQRPEDACRVLREYLPGKHKKKMYRFLALILADAQVDEKLEYPDADAIMAEAKRLEETL